MKTTYRHTFAALRRGRQNLLAAALACAVAFTTTTQAQIPFAPDSRVSLSLPLQASEDLTYGAVTESLWWRTFGERAEPAAHQPGEQHLVHRESVQQLRAEQRPMEQQLEFPARDASEPDQRLEPDHAAGDALVQHRPARDGPRQLRAGHRAGRSGSGGVAVACELGQLDSRSRAYRHLPDCDIAVHWPGKVAARTQFRGGLPHEGVLHWRVSPAMVVHRRACTAGPTRTR